MSRKRTTYSTSFKIRLVLEVIKEESTLVEIASKNNITPKNLQNWKKTFLEKCAVNEVREYIIPQEVKTTFFKSLFYFHMLPYATISTNLS